MKITYHFIPMGSVTTAELGKIYIDVGNHFAPGQLDHHQATAPNTCTATLVLEHPDYVLSQLTPNSEIQLITHLYPDIDAISGIYFAQAHLQQRTVSPAFRSWAEYVCQMDRGETVLNPAQAITPYSVLVSGLHQARQSHRSPEAASHAMLETGLKLIDTIIAQLAQGDNLDSPSFFGPCPELQAEIAAVQADWQRYLNDMKRAELFHCPLPNATGQGVKTMPGLWINQPSAILFKAWARGDAKRAGHTPGFVFTGIQVNPQRAILSVMPDSGVNLKGLGEALEKAETTKRERIGKIRTGQNRPGYQSPDPWYDGRSPLHAYTIVDAPYEGSVLTEPEIRQVFEQWLTSHQ